MTDAPTKPRGRLARRSPRRSGPCARALSLLAALVTVFATMIAGPLPAAHAMGNGDWSVDPYVPPGTDQNNRRYFYMDGAAGETLTDTAVVANSSDHPITLKLFGADAFNTPRDGAFSVRQFTDKMKGVGLWLKVANGQDTLTIQPQTRVAVPFSITIPADATPGDWVGGIMALNPDAIGQQTQGQLKVDLKMQVGARIYLNVKGPRMPAMDVRDVRIQRDTGFSQFFGSSDAEVHYKVVNKGNVIIRPVTDIKATGIFGRTLLDKKHDPTKAGPEIFPGQEVELVVKWHDAPLLDRVNFKVSATSDTQDGGQPLGDSESVSYTAVPWPALLILAILLIVGSVAWQLLRNRKRGGGKGGDPAEKSGPKGPAGDAENTPGDADGGKPAGKKGAKDKGAKTPAANAAENAPTAPAAPATPPAKPATAPAETPEPATTKAESAPSAKSDAAADKAAAKGDAAKRDAPKGEAAESDAAKADTAKDAAAKADTAKSDAPEADAAKSDAPKAADAAEGTAGPASKTSVDDKSKSAPDAADGAEAGSADTAGDPAGVSR
ncbi:WxL protein peptidoglycan domain-containing protein [Yinghuangia aomiensis]